MADIAVLNSNDDLLEIMASSLQRAGWSVTTAHVRELKLHPERIEELMRREDPRLIVLDVSPPYVENWEWYRTVFAPHPAVQGRRIVLTTTNRRALQEASDTGDTIELLGKPFDLEQLVAAVRHALR